MLTPISEYILRSRDERRSHLNLNEPCLLIFEECAGNRGCRGILAVFLKTTVPYKQAVYACHACNNDRCGNPLHLYWGTPTDNVRDQIEAGTYVPISKKTLAIYGEEGLLRIRSHAGKKGGAATRKKRRAGRSTLGNPGWFKPGHGTPRTWGVGSRKGIKIPKRKKAKLLESPNGEGRPGR